MLCFAQSVCFQSGLEFRFRFFDTASDSPSSLLAEQITADYADTSALKQFAHGLDVVTYEFAPDSKMISKSALTLPNQQEMILVEVADLTPLIEKSEFSISEDELEIVKSDKVPESIYADGDQLFGYGVAAEEHEDLEKKANQ